MEEALVRQEDEPIRIDWRERFYDVQTQSIKNDIRDLKDDVKRLETKIDNVEKSLNAEIDNVEKSLNAKTDMVRNELLKEMKNLNDKINESYWKILLGISIIMGIFTYLTK